MLTAESFIEKLESYRSDEELRKIQRYFKSGEGEYGEGDIFIGVRMGQVFELAKEFINMPPEEIERLMESPIHEVRAGAMSIMGKSAAHKKATEARKKELYDLYIRRHDRINNWDLVDLAAQYVLGGYLYNKPRDICIGWRNRKIFGSGAARCWLLSIFCEKENWTIAIKSRKCL